MFYYRFIRDVEDVTKDVGQELKNTAKRTYKVAVVIYNIILVLELILFIIGIVEAAQSIKSIGGFIYNLLAYIVFYALIAGCAYLIFIRGAYRITIAMYANGETVHYLRDINEKIKIMGADTPKISVDENWVCKKCGTENLMKYGQCKKCGSFKQ